MPDQKITELTELTSGQIADTDVLPIVDVDADATKKWTWASVKADILSWIGAVTATFTNKTIDADNNTITNIGTSELSDGGVTLAKMADIAQDHFIGRHSVGSGVPQVVSATQARTILNVEDGATADMTGAEIKAAYEAEADTNAFTDAEKSKLAGIAAGAEVNTVDSVNGATGTVVLDADDIDDTATTNKFTTAADISKLAGIETGADVTDSTNVDAAGAVMNSDTSTATMSFVVDEDNMVSDLATKVPTQQSVKAYVDTGLSGKQDTITNSDSITEGSTNLFMTTSERSKLSGIETGADVTDAENIATSINGATNKTTPVDADVFGILDSAASMALKKLTWANLKATIKTYYDSVTATLTNKTLTDAVNSVSTPTTTSVGYLGVPQESKSANYTLVLADAGKHIYHPASDANDRTFTIPANASVAYPIGTTVTFVNLSANTVTIAITSDTMNLIGAGSTGSRALAQYGMATALKVASTTWVINGTNLS